MGGRKTPSLMGSRQSVYSHTSSAVRTYKSGPKSHKSHRSVQKWYMKPMMKSAIYTDLQRGAWHIAFYTLVSWTLWGFWSILTALEIFFESIYFGLSSCPFCLILRTFWTFHRIDLCDLIRHFVLCPFSLIFKIYSQFHGFFSSFCQFGPFSPLALTFIAYMRPILELHTQDITS